MDKMDFLISICTYTEFPSTHVLKLHHFLTHRDWFQWKILKISCSPFLFPVFWVLRTTSGTQTQPGVYCRLLLPARSTTAVMFPVSELLFRCHWTGFAMTVAEATAGFLFNTLHTSTCKMSRYYSPVCIIPLLINPLTDFLTLCTAVNAKCHGVRALCTLGSHWRTAPAFSAGDRPFSTTLAPLECAWHTSSGSSFPKAATVVIFDQS